MAKSVEQIVDGLVVKAVKTWSLIRPGERILIGASGGKDSAILARDLGLKKRQGRLDAEISALHIRNDFSPRAMSPALASMYGEWGIPLTTLDVGVTERLKPGRTMNCWWCSTQRRTELIKYAIEHGFTSIALGHHLDDVLETLFMNMMGKAELATMPPVVVYKKYPLRVIRPLYLVEENQIIELGRALGLVKKDDEDDTPATTCTCGFNENSERGRVRSRVEALTGGSSAEKRNLLASLGNINAEYLPSGEHHRA